MPFGRSGLKTPVCVEDIRYIGHDALRRDIKNFKAALGGVEVAEAYLPANTPGTIEHWMPNEHYASDESFVFAIAEAMREEYEAIVEAGFLLQIDDPDLPDGWNCLPEMSVAEYRAYAAMRVDALNHALRDIPPEHIRMHVCWGNNEGPHHLDVPLAEIIELLLTAKPAGLSIEGANPRHQHEWNVFERVNLPDEKVLVPGVIDSTTNFIEHPELVAQRIVRYAQVVGTRERHSWH